MKQLKRHIGLTIIVIGALHTILGMVKFSGVFATMFSEGLFNSVNTADRNFAFWFTFCGIVFILLGLIIKQLENQQMAIPFNWGLGLLTSTLLGIVFIPASGFWALLLPSYLILSTQKSS